MKETASVAASVHKIKDNGLSKPEYNVKISDFYGSVSCKA